MCSTDIVPSPLCPPHRSFLEKASSTATITNTPDVFFTEDLIYAMANITDLVQTQWVFGAAFANDTVAGWDSPLRVVDFVEQVLGDNLIGIQLSNEPDLYDPPAASKPGCTGR